MKAALAGLALFIGTLGGAAAQEKKDEPFWKSLDAKITGSVGEFKVGDYAGESAEIDITAKDGKVNVEKLNVTSGENELDLSGEVTISDDPGKLDLKQADFALNVDARDVEQFIAKQTKQPLRGDVSVTGKIAQKDGLIDGSLVIAGSGVHFAGLDIASIDGAVEIERSVVQLRKLTITLPGGSEITAAGSYDLREPSSYTGELHADVKQLAQFEPLLRSFGQDAELAGALLLNWKGRGQLVPASHSGEGALAIREGRYNEIEAIEADIAGAYSPETIQFPNLRLQSAFVGVRADVELREAVLRVSDLAVRQNGAAVANGDFRVPVDLSKWKTPAELIPADRAIAVDLKSRSLDVAKLPGIEGKNLRGALNANVHLEGSLETLRGDLTVRGRGLHSAAMGKLAPASADLTITIANDRLAAAGTLRQPKLQPLALTGTMPFHVPAILRQRRIDPASPITASIRLPSSSLDFVETLSPIIEELRGRAAAQIDVAGTLRDPELSGSITVELARLHADATAVHDVRDGRIELRFHDQTLFVEKFAAKLAGGPLSISGTVQFPELTKPVLDLAVRGDSVLLVRNDHVTVRADLALSLTGPLATARLAGTAGLVESEFFREIEILPLKLPGRAAPAVAEGAGAPVSITAPPVRDWTFDVSITTRTPFLIGSNLADGAVVGDLKLGGTGLAPTLVGTAEVENLIAALPFSRLRIVRGFAYFLAGGALLNPQLDLHGVSEIRDYQIDVYIYGTAQNPETLFVSRPPLPQEEIISLLATGATRQELTGNENVLAGRATWLVLRKLYRKFFGGDIGDNDIAFLDRIDVDLGAVDPQTGEQSLVTRFEISKKWVLVGIANIGGGVGGRLKYVVRFR